MNKSNLLGLLLFALCVVHPSYAQLTCDEKAEITLQAEANFKDYPIELIKETLEYIIPCAEEGNPAAQYAAGVLTLLTDDPNREFPGYNYLFKASRNGYGPASFKLAMSYYAGESRRFGVSYKNAVNYFYKMQQQNYKPDIALYARGYITMKNLHNKYNYPKNYALAKSMFSYSNHPMAKHWLAVLHYFGLGVSKNEEYAKQLLSENNIINSQTLLDFLSTQNTDWIQMPAEEYAAIRYTIDQSPIIYYPNPVEISKTYQGNLIEFDWASYGIKRNLPFTLKLDVENTEDYKKKVQYDLTIEGKIYSGQGTNYLNRIEFDSLAFPLKRLYKDHPDIDTYTYKIDKIRFKEGVIDGNPALYGKVEIGNIIELNEPTTAPIRFILRPEGDTQNTIASLDQRQKTAKKPIIIEKNFATVSPNPIGNEFNITYSLDQSAEVQISIYDFYGQQRLKLPSQRNKTNGKQTITVNSSALASGTYVIQMTIDGLPYSKTVVKQ